MNVHCLAKPNFARCVSLIGLALILIGPPAGALAQSENGGKLYFGIGSGDYENTHSPAPGIAVEYGSPTFGWQQGFRFRAAFMGNTDADLWVGVGLSYEFNFGNSPWFTEISFVPGIFRRGNALPGETAVIFHEYRSQIALGYEFESGRSLALTRSHRSNGFTCGPIGACIETIMVRYSIPF